MVSYHAEKHRADTYKDKLIAMSQELEEIKYERDCYKAVLVGMEFQKLEELPSKGLDFCELLGTEAASRIKKEIGYPL